MLKYDQADSVLLKKMREEDLADIMRDSRGKQSLLTKGFSYEHFLKASQALNNIQKGMQYIYEWYKHLYDEGILEHDEGVL